MSAALSRGLVQVYTGEGKGKTTAALGLAVRAVGRGLRVIMIQFLKGEESGETLFVNECLPWRLCSSTKEVASSSRTKSFVRLWGELRLGPLRW